MAQSSRESVEHARRGAAAGPAVPLNNSSAAAGESNSRQRPPGLGPRRGRKEKKIKAARHLPTSR